MVIAAIDLIDGVVVRLYQGDYGQKTEYALNPIDVVHSYADQGGEWLHIVDLSGAKDASKRQLGLIKSIADTGRMKFQAGGGIRSEDDVKQLLELGVSRVVIGSVAVKHPEQVQQWVKRYGPEAVVLALDVRVDDSGLTSIATHGWQSDSGVRLEELLEGYLAVGAKHVLCTDISRDGTLSGSNHELYTRLSAQFDTVEWQASGGIGSLDDIRRLRPSGVSSVILGRALLEAKFTLKEALQCWRAE